MIMVEVIAAVPINEVGIAAPSEPPSGVVTPVPGRIPACPIRTPKPVVDNRPVDIDRFNHIVFSVDIFVANDLHGDIIGFVLFDIDGCYILIDVLGKHCLQDD